MMARKDDNTNESVKVCNHKPGDPWEEKGCCKSQKAANQDQKNQVVNQETRELSPQAEKDKLSQMVI